MRRRQLCPHDPRVCRGTEKLCESDKETERWIGQIVECAAEGIHPTEYYDETQGKLCKIETHGLQENASATAVSLADQILTRALRAGHVVTVGDDPYEMHYEFDCGGLVAYMEREYGVGDILSAMQHD